MARLKIDGDMLISAFDNNSGDAEFYLDSETGEVLFMFDGYLSGEDEPRDPDEVDLDSGRYFWIDGRPSGQSWQVMADFAEAHTEGEVFQDLARALRGRKPFRTFKDALTNYPDVREQWFAYREAEMIEYARRWLLEAGVDADIEHRGKIIKGLEPASDEEE